MRQPFPTPSQVKRTCFNPAANIARHDSGRGCRRIFKRPRQFRGVDEINRPKCLNPNLKPKRYKIRHLAGFCRLIWSNLCTRHIQRKLTPRGHHDWPDKATTRPIGLLLHNDLPGALASCNFKCECFERQVFRGLQSSSTGGGGPHGSLSSNIGAGLSGIPGPIGRRKGQVANAEISIQRRLMFSMPLPTGS